MSLTLTVDEHDIADTISNGDLDLAEIIVLTEREYVDLADFADVIHAQCAEAAEERAKKHPLLAAFLRDIATAARHLAEEVERSEEVVQ